MMLRLAVAKVLFDKHAKQLLNEEISICNKFIGDYNRVKEMMEE